MSIIYDDRYEMLNDNPFDDGNLKMKAKTYVNEHNKEFILNDWKENIHSKDVIEIDDNSYDGMIFNCKMNDDLNISSIENFANIVKGFFNKYNTKFLFSNELMEWANTTTSTKISTNTQPLNDDSFDSYSEEVDSIDISEGVDYFDTRTEKIEFITYDSSSSIALTYDEICKMCINQARRQLITSRSKNVEVEKLELDRKNELIDEILKLYEIAEIQIETKKDLTRLSIPELEELLKRCEIKFDSLKTKDMIKTWLSTGSIVYDNVFPGGLPIGKNRKLRVKSIGKDLDNVLLNSRTVSGQAFRRILDKHHVHISDETMVLSKLANILIKNAEIVKTDEVDENEEESEEDNEYSYDSTTDVLASVSD